MPATSVKNLIFDLGGVILDLSVDHTLQAFSKLSGIGKGDVQKIFNTSPGFELYEKGVITDLAFRDFVREVYRIQADNKAIDESWNAMLRGIPMAKLDLLKRLRLEYNVYLLSNTNGIHLGYINQVMMPEITGEDSLTPYFHKAYYSHLMGKRKPDAEIFEQVLDENGLLPEQTLFLDDNASNVAGASALGIQTVHVTSSNLILEYFS
ncbi:MAG: HAD family hydrolase [Bacteroidota bacterium]